MAKGGDELSSVPYESLSDFTNTDWTFFIGGLACILIGIFVAGRDEPIFGLRIWSTKNFSSFLVLFGLGLLGGWLANAMADGNLDTILYDDVGDLANTFGFLAGLSLTSAVAVASVLDRNAIVPSAVGPALGAVGFTLLFASGLTITMQSFFDDAFTGGSWADIMPLFPMNEFICYVWTTLLLGLAVGSASALVRGQTSLVEDLLN